MKNLILTTIAALLIGLSAMAQAPKKATTIIVHSNEATKTVALNDFIDHLTANDIFFFDVNENRGIARSEEFGTSGMGNWTTQSTIIVVAKETSDGIELVITGSTKNFTGYGEATVEMINKHFMGHVGGVMFDHVNDIVMTYDNKDLLTYSR